MYETRQTRPSRVIIQNHIEVKVVGIIHQYFEIFALADTLAGTDRVPGNDLKIFPHWVLSHLNIIAIVWMVNVVCNAIQMDVGNIWRWIVIQIQRQYGDVVTFGCQRVYYGRRPALVDGNFIKLIIHHIIWFLRKYQFYQIWWLGDTTPIINNMFAA